MSFFHLSILISALMGLIIIAWIRSFDIYERETFIVMFWAFFAGGITSVLIAVGIYEFLLIFGIDDTAISTTLGSFLVIGPLEEFAKLMGLIIVYGMIKRRFNELTDGIVYMSCVALGFSIIENYFYANTGENSQYLLVFRAFISTPAHISFSVFIGYAWYRYKNENKPLRIVIIAWLFASLLHGIFDALAFSPYFNFMLLVYLYLILYQSLRVVQYSNVISPFRPAFTALFDNPSGEVVSDLECPYCKSAAPKVLFRNSYFTSCRCDNCRHHISSVRDIANIFRIFAPEYKVFRKKLMTVKLNDVRTIVSVYGSAFIDDKGKMGFFRVDDVAGKIGVINEAIVTRFRQQSFISGNLLRRLFE